MPILHRCPGINGARCARLVEGRRCDEHQRQADLLTLRRKRAVRPYTSTEQERRAEAVREHRAEYGDWCPGLPGVRGGHPDADLTADHVHAVGSGGREDGPLVVRCRSCNAIKGARDIGDLAPPGV